MGFGLGLSGGTTGIGPIAGFPVSEEVSIRLGMGFLSLDRDQDVDTLTYDMEIGLRWFPVLLDYNPHGGLIRLSGGLMFNGSSADASYVPEVTVELGGHTYTPEDVGEVVGEIQMQPVSPYLGVGLGKPSGGSPGMRFLLDLGVAFTSFDVSLGHQGGDLPAELEEQLDEDLAMEADSLQNALDDFQMYPVLSAGLMYSW